MKFDFYFFLGFAMQLLIVITSQTDVEFWLTIAAIPIVIFVLLMSGYWVRRESLPGMIIVIVGFSTPSFELLLICADHLRCWPRLLLLQARPNLGPRREIRVVQTSQQRIDHIRCHYYPTHHSHHCPRHPMRSQLRQRPKTLLVDEEDPGRRREELQH